MNSFWSASWRNLSIATFTAIFSSSLVPFSRRKKPSEAEPRFIFAPPPGLPSAIFDTGRARGQPRLRLCLQGSQNKLNHQNSKLPENIRVSQESYCFSKFSCTNFASFVSLSMMVCIFPRTVWVVSKYLHTFFYLSIQNLMSMCLK